MDSYFYLSVVYAVVSADGHTMDIDIKLLCDDIGYIVEHALAVDSPYLDGGIKEEHFVHVPFCVENTVAKARLEPVGYGACPLVKLYLVLVVDISQDVVARNGVAACGDDVHAY